MGSPELCQTDVTLSDRPWKHFAHLLMREVAPVRLGETQPDLRGKLFIALPLEKGLVAGLLFLL